MKYTWTDFLSCVINQLSWVVKLINVIHNLYLKGLWPWWWDFSAAARMNHLAAYLLSQLKNYCNDFHWWWEYLNLLWQNNNNKKKKRTQRWFFSTRCKNDFLWDAGVALSGTISQMISRWLPVPLTSASCLAAQRISKPHMFLQLSRFTAWEWPPKGQTLDSSCIFAGQRWQPVTEVFPTAAILDSHWNLR